MTRRPPILIPAFLLVAVALCVPTASPRAAEAETVEVEGTQPGPPPPLPDLAEPNSRAAEPAEETNPRPAIPKVLKRSGSQAGGPANDLNPSGRAEEPAPAKGDLARVIQGKELFHGNYCGAGQRGEGLEPVDALDAACQRHDACYEAAGRPSCACDRTLKREAARVSDRPDVSLETRRRALSVAEATDAMRCEGP